RRPACCGETTDRLCPHRVWRPTAVRSSTGTASPRPGSGAPAMSESLATQRITKSRGDAAVLTAVLIGSLVAVGLGVFGKVHEPQFFSVNVAGFSSGTAVKAWLGTLAVALALFQLVSAFAMYRLIPGGRAPAWMGIAHVWSGRLAVVAS